MTEWLLELTDGTMHAVFFTSGGAEANESAFKTARFYWKAVGRPDKVKIVARDQAYHGLTLQTMSATGMGRGYWKMFEPRVPGFVHAPTCHPYRCEDAQPGETAGQAAARAIKEAMDSVAPEDRWMHAYTYSGHPVCCAVANRNIEIMERDRLCENAAAMGARLEAGLQDAFAHHPHAGDVRGGLGLLAAVEFVEDRATQKNFAGEMKFAATLKAEMRNRGVITRTRPAVGAHPAPGDILFFAPPLVVT